MPAYASHQLLLITELVTKDRIEESLRQKVKTSLMGQKTEIKFNDWVKSLREGAYIEIWLYED